MPVITLYGSKGGTGRTTSAAALAAGLMAEGYEVTLVDTNTEYRLFQTWGECLVGSGAPNCRLGQADHIMHLVGLLHELHGDPNRFAIIDTPREATDLRLMAVCLTMPYAPAKCLNKGGDSRANCAISDNFHTAYLKSRR